MWKIDQPTREFIARDISDIGKAILTVGFASYFFEKLPVPLRAGFVVLGVGCLILGILIYAWRGVENP